MKDLIKGVGEEDPLIKDWVDKIFNLIRKSHLKIENFPLEFKLDEKVRGTSSPSSSLHLIKFTYKYANGSPSILAEDVLTLDDKEKIASNYVRYIVDLLKKGHDYTLNELWGLFIEYEDSTNTFKINTQKDS